MQQIPKVGCYQIPSLRTWACRQRPGLSFTSCRQAHLPETRPPNPNFSPPSPVCCRQSTITVTREVSVNIARSMSSVSRLDRKHQLPVHSESAAAGTDTMFRGILTLLHLQQLPVLAVSCTPKGSDGRFPQLGSSCSAQHASTPFACIKLPDIHHHLACVYSS